MTRTIILTSCVALLAGAAISQVAALPGTGQTTKGEFVFVAKVKTCTAVAAGMSMPPVMLYSMTFEGLEMIKGDKPDKMALTYSARNADPKVIAEGAKVLVNAKDGVVASIVEATDEAVKAAGGKASTQPASAPASGPATKPASAPAGGEWTKLFADEQWYKQQAGKEEVFAGKLEAVPQAGGFSTLMRTSYYKLGDRTIYTGAKKVKALDGLVGKKVEMRGKGVSMNLEGQALSEIWPAVVRAAD